MTVVVTDNGQPSLSATQSFGVTVRRMNRPPVISLASAFAGEAGQSVALTASVTDDGLPTGGALSVRWEPVSGPGQVTSPTLDGASITVIVSSAGEYQFRLTATDGELISTAMTTLVATMSNVAPLVTAGPNQFVRLPNSVTLPGFVTDDGRPVGTVVSALWSVVSGPGMVTFAEPAATNTSATFSAVGDYVLRLTANDTALTGHADARIAVRDELVNQPPFVNAGQDIQAGLTYAVFLSGTVTDDGLPAGNSLQVGWQLVSGPSAVEFESTNQTATMATFALSGRYVLRLSASDGQFTVSDELVVDVFTTNLPPTVEAGSDQVLLAPDPALLMAGGAQPRDPHTSLAMSLFGEARWNNTVGQPGLVGDWAGLLNGLDYSDGNVVVTGPFDTAGGVYVRGLARWDGTNFWPYYDPRPTDPNDPLSPPFGYIEDEHPETRIKSIGASGREVFASGGFLRDPRGSGNGVLTARWDGEHWLPWEWHGQSRYVGVSDILVGRDRAVYVAGNFSFQPTNSGGGLITYPDLPISYGVAKWTGSHWTNLADGVRTYADTGSGIQLAAGAYVSAVAEGKNGEIYVSGLFDMPTPFGGATNIAVWNGTNWAPLGTGIQGCYRYACNPSPRALAVDDDGRLYVGGDIAFAGGVPVRNLAMWDGANWHDVGGGVAYEVLALATHGRDLYVGPAGEAGGIPVNGIARWNGSFWSPLGSGSTNGIVGSPMSMVATPRGIYVAGAFQTAGGQPARNIAFWEFPEEPERFVRLNGRVTDDGLPYAGAVSQQWAKASGPGEVIFADAASPMTTATFTAVGTYVLRLTANDTEHTVLDEVVIEVRANQPPVVNAGPDLAVALTDKPVLPGAVTDDGLPSNASLVSVWTQVGGPANARIMNPNQPRTQVGFSVPGTYVFRLQANDSQFSVFDDVTVVVASANNPPTISSYVPGAFTLPWSMNLQAFASDDGRPNGTLVRAWSKVSGPGEAVFANPADGYTTVSFRKAGTYVLQFAASDSELVTTQSFTIQVIDPGDGGALLAAGCDFTAFAGQSTGLPGWIDDDQPWSDLAVAWQVWEGPGTVTFGDPAQPNSTATFSAPGVYRLALNARDSTGWHSDEVFVTVLPPPDINQPPVIQLPPAFWVIHSTSPVPLTATLQDDGLPAGTLTWLWQQTGGPATATLLTPSGSSVSPRTLVAFPSPGAYTFSLTASDSALSATNGTLEVRVVDPTFAGISIGYAQPSVNAGPDATVSAGTPHTLQGTIIEANSPKWTVVSGPGQVLFDSPYLLNTAVTFVDPGSYRLRLTGDNPFGSVSDDVLITVTGNVGNRAPVVDAGPSTNLFLPSISTVFNGSFTDDGFPTGGNVTVEWTLMYGDTPVTIADPHSLTTAVTFDGVAEFIAGYHDWPAWYWFKLRVSDGELTGEAYLYAQVADPADGWAAPTVHDAGPDRTVAPGSVIQLQANAQSIYGYTPQVEWQQIAGPRWADVNDWWSATPRIRLETLGAYTFRAIVWDELIETDTVTLTVTNSNAIPFVDAGGPQTFPFPDTPAAVLAGAVIDDGQPHPMSVAWTQVSGPATVRLLAPTALQTDVQFDTAGAYVFRLTVTDGEATMQSEVTVNTYLNFNFSNRPPVVNAGSDRLTTVGATFFTSATITDDNAVTYSWTQLSGPAPAPVSYAGASFPDARLSFTAPGEYRFRLTASDSVYAAGDDVVINVQSAANAAPIARYRPLEHPTAGGPTFLRAVISDDCHPDNTGLSAQWHPWYGPGTVTFGNQTLTPLPGGSAIEVLTEATFTQPGNYGLRLHVSDGSLAADYYYTVAVFAPVAPNDPPLANAGPDQTVATSAWFDLTGSVSDDGLPAGGLLSASWSLASGPGPVYFHGAAATNTQAQVPVAGVYVFRLSASDGEQTAVDDVTITAVAPTNRAPFVFAGNDFSVTRPNAGSLQGLASDDGLPAGYPLVAEWSQVAGPAGVVLAARTNAVTSATFPTSGAYVLRLTAFDGQFTSTDDVSVTVIEGTNAPPMVNAGADIAALVNTPAALSGSATDDGLPNGYLQSAWSQVSGPGTARVTTLNGAYRVTADTAGAYVLRLSASDGIMSASDDVTVTVHASVPPPVVAITAPLDAGEVTAPTAVIGTADSPILVGWTLEYRFKPSDSDLNSQPSTLNWTPLSTATTNVVNNALGVLDPTLSLNGIYELRLTATDQIGRTSMTDPLTVVFDRSMKIGQFAFSFNDLTIPVAGIPITITRSYDSRNKQPGDFGVGWTLDIANIRVQKNRNLGRNWQQTSTGGDFPVYAVETARPRMVTVTFPSGKVYKFGVVPEPTAQFVFPIGYPRMTFVPLPGTYGTLTPVFLHYQSGERIVDDWTVFPTPIPGTGDLISYERLIDPSPGPADNILWNPAMFEFTTQEGYAYLLSETNGLHKVTDPNGNTLTITTNGIIHSSGKNVLFERDDLGRITNIVDAAGHPMSYSYDANGNLAQFIDRAGNTNTFSYDGRHNLLNVTDARGITPASNEYDVSGRLVRHIDAFGKVIEYTHNLGDRQEVLRDRLGNITIHEYDERGNVITTAAPDGGVTLSTYDANDNLLSVTDPLGRGTTYTYDAEDNRTSVTDPLGNTTRLTYGPKRRVSSVTDPRGNTITNVFDAAGNLLSMTDPLGNVTTFGYNAQGLPLTATNAHGQVMRWGYDSHGWLTNEVDAYGHATALQRDANGNLTVHATTRTTPNGLETLTRQFQYDALSRLTNSVLPDGSSIQTIYNAIGKPAVTIDQLGRQTVMEYDELGRLRRSVNSDGTSEGIAFDDEGRRVAVTNRLGQVTRFHHDAVGRMNGVAHPDGTATTNYFDLGGQFIAATDARGFTTFYGYDLAGRTVAVTNALGEVSRADFDAAGNVTNAVDNLGRTTTFIYNALNRRVRTVFADGTTQNVHFDAAGRQVAVTDQAGISTWFGYDALGRLTSVTNALGHVTRYAYDELGELISQTDANSHATTFEYDSLGRRIKRTLPGGQTETYAYNVAGRMTGRTDFNGFTTTYQYDALNRLLARVPDVRLGQTAVTFTYNALGLRDSMTDASGVTTYQYDVRSRLVQKATPQGTLTYGYDVNDNVTSIQSSNSNGTDVAYEYDALNRLSGVNDARLGRTPYTYDGVGNLRGFTHPNGVTCFHEYDTLNRLTNLTAGTVLNTLAQYRHTVGLAGNRLTTSETVVPNGVPTTINRVYQYDALYRLTGEQITGGTTAGLTYQYDSVGNRLARISNLPVLPSQTSGYDANDRLLSDHYDANGNTVVGRVFPSASLVSDHYDFEDRLISRNNGQVTVVYDGDGNRVRKTVGGVTTHYLVDDLNPTGYAQVVEELTSAGGTPVVTRVYTYGHDLLAQDQVTGSNWQASFYGYDGMGSVRYLTDLNGLVTDTYAYDAHGNLIASTGSTPNNYLYRGEQFDPDLGLYYLRARYHNPDTGRFWTADPFEGFGSDPASLHHYTYAQNNPANWIDPSGNVTLGEVMHAGAIGAVMQGVLGTLSRSVGAVSGGAGWADAMDIAGGNNTLMDLGEGFVGGALGLGMAKGAVWAMGRLAPYTPNLAVAFNMVAARTGQAWAKVEAAWVKVQRSFVQGTEAAFQAARNTLVAAEAQWAKLSNLGTRIRNALGWYEAEAMAAESAASQTGTILWSGPGAKDAAIWLANNTSGVTLEMTELGAQTELATVGMDYLTQAKPIWEAASKRFVQNASGEVTIVLSRSANPSSIFFTIEWKALLQNPNVTGVKFIHIP